MSWARVIGCVLVMLVTMGQGTLPPNTTLCPTVSDQTALVGVIVTGTPRAFDYASYDMKTLYLTIAYQWQTSQMLTGVPKSLIIGHATVPWVSLSRYPSAIMQERSVCPLLAETTAVTPLIIQ